MDGEIFMENPIKKRGMILGGKNHYFWFNTHLYVSSQNTCHSIGRTQVKQDLEA